MTRPGLQNQAQKAPKIEAKSLPGGFKKASKRVSKKASMLEPILKLCLSIFEGGGASKWLPLLPLLPLVESPRSSFIEKEEEQKNALGSKGPTMHNTQRTVASYSLVNKDCRLLGGSAPRALSLFTTGRLKEKLARAPP